LFVGGALFGYFVVFPPGFQFAVGILHDTDILLFPKMSEYLSFALRLLLAFGLIFELPLLLWLMGRLGVVDARQLRRARKYIIVVIFLIAGILTPGPDVLSQLLMAAPLWILFETGILLVRFWGAKDKISTERLEVTEGR
jgi:sec-independent protein translocase protein TatC